MRRRAIPRKLLADLAWHAVQFNDRDVAVNVCLLTHSPELDETGVRALAAIAGRLSASAVRALEGVEWTEGRAALAAPVGGGLELARDVVRVLEVAARELGHGS